MKLFSATAAMALCIVPWLCRSHDACAQESEPPYSIPPLTSDQMDLFIDALRSGRSLQFPPFHSSGKVDPLIEGIWAGSSTEVESSNGPITLRFRRRLDALAAAPTGQSVKANDLLESFDIHLEQTNRYLIVRHSHPLNAREQGGISFLVDRAAKGVQVVPLQGARDSGVFLGVPALLDADSMWGVLVCPRSFGPERRGKSGFAVVDLLDSPYELSEVRLSFQARGSVAMSTAGRMGRARIGLKVTEALPAAEQGFDEGISPVPKARFRYVPSIPFDFFRFAPYASIQQGTVLQVQMQNRKGWMRTENFSNTVYIQKLGEVSPVSPVVNRRGVERNEGECYAVLKYRHSWREYREEPNPPWAKAEEG